MSLDMADEEDGRGDYFLEMPHCGLKVVVKGLSLIFSFWNAFSS